jgi:hypothetical protein
MRVLPKIAILDFNTENRQCSAAYYNDKFFLKHRKRTSSGGSTVSSAGDNRWMSTGICRSNGHYLIGAPSKAEQLCQFRGACKNCSSELFFWSFERLIWIFSAIFW